MLLIRASPAIPWLMGDRDGWRRLAHRITAAAQGLVRRLRPAKTVMTGPPPSARLDPVDPAQHAHDFALRYAEEMDYLASQRMLELGIDPDAIGSSDLTHGIRHAAFYPFLSRGRAGAMGPVVGSSWIPAFSIPTFTSIWGKRYHTAGRKAVYAIAWMRSSLMSMSSSSRPATPKRKRAPRTRNFPSATGPEISFASLEGARDDS